MLGTDDSETLRRLPGVGENNRRVVEDERAGGDQALLAVHGDDLARVDVLDAGQAEAAQVDVQLRADAVVGDGHLVLRLPLHQLPRLDLRDLDVRQPAVVFVPLALGSAAMAAAQGREDEQDGGFG